MVELVVVRMLCRQTKGGGQWRPEEEFSAFLAKCLPPLVKPNSTIELNKNVRSARLVLFHRRIQLSLPSRSFAFVGFTLTI